MQINNLPSLPVGLANQPSSNTGQISQMRPTEAQQLPSPAKTIADEYNVTDISYSELIDLAQTLRDENLLSSEEAALLQSTASGLMHVDKYINQGDGNPRIDSIEQWSRMITFEKSQSSASGIESDERILNIFKGLYSLRGTSISHKI